MPNNEFFTIESNKRAINDFINSISINSTVDFVKNRNILTRTMLSVMVANDHLFDKHCQFSTRYIGSKFINLLQNSDKGTDDNIDDIFATCFRFLMEFYLTTKEELSFELNQVRAFVSENIDNFKEDVKLQITFSLQQMPIAILKDLINNDKTQSFIEFNTSINKASILKQTWDKEIEDRETKVNQIKNALDKYEKAFNFVGLYKGFDELNDIKHKEKKTLFRSLLILSILIITPIVTELFFVYFNLSVLKNLGISSLLILVPILSLVVVFIYYFRVLLINYKSVKSQILQIELRKTLCRFIQSYAEYSHDIKQKDPDLLNKFESIIFSGIVTDEDKLPSTFDGLEKITDFVKSFK